MHYVTFGFLGQHRHGTAFHQYLRLRKWYFVDVLGWDIPHDDDVEMDQYDNPCAHYVLVLRGSTVVGGARMMPTTASWGQHSYMLRDALLGRIDIPPQVVSGGDRLARRLGMHPIRRLRRPRHPGRTRGVPVADPVGMRRSCSSENGGSEVISLSPVPMLRTLRQLGYPANRIGEPYSEMDGRRYAMIRIPALTPAHAIAAE